jgi:hypothetical protein
LKVRVSLEFYKSFRGINVISLVLLFDLTPNLDG